MSTRARFLHRGPDERAKGAPSLSGRGRISECDGGTRRPGAGDEEVPYEQASGGQGRASPALEFAGCRPAVRPRLSATLDSMAISSRFCAAMREEYDRIGDANSAITEGLGRTGRLVTSAALILFLAFASLASAPDTDIKVLATGLGVGILLDATIVRALLVPALVSLFGRWNWWLPRPAARVLGVRVGPSPIDV